MGLISMLVVCMPTSLAHAAAGTVIGPNSTAQTNLRGSNSSEMLLGSSASVGCASWCTWSPSSTWQWIPSCTGCGAIRSMTSCTDWCVNSPSASWQWIPSCDGCSGRIYALAPTGAEMSQQHPNHRWHNAAVVLRFKPRLVMVGVSTPLSRVGHPFQSVQDAQQVKLACVQIGATMSHQTTGKLFQIAVGASRDSAFSRNFCI